MVSGQLRGPAALPPGNEPPVPIGQEAAVYLTKFRQKKEDTMKAIDNCITSIRLQLPLPSSVLRST
jgi:hypothetical protein